MRRFTDALTILRGRQGAATQYFRNSMTAPLTGQANSLMKKVFGARK